MLSYLPYVCLIAFIICVMWRSLLRSVACMMCSTSYIRRVPARRTRRRKREKLKTCRWQSKADLPASESKQTPRHESEYRAIAGRIPSHLALYYHGSMQSRRTCEQNRSLHHCPAREQRSGQVLRLHTRCLGREQSSSSHSRS